jgi:hypothetical protein
VGGNRELFRQVHPVGATGFFAKIVAANLTALMALGAQQITAKETKHLKRNYQINFA